MRKVRSVWSAGVLAVLMAGCGPTVPSVEVEGAPPALTSEEADDPGRCARPGPNDINGDGHADAVVGADLSTDGSGGQVDTYGEAGGIHVFYGSSGGLTADGADGRPDDQVFGRGSPGVPGDPTRDEWGKALAVADFDGDGCADVAVGAPAAALRPSSGADGSETGSSAGEVTILYGTPVGLSARGVLTVRQDNGGKAPAGMLLVPGDREKDDRFGAALAAADFDGDGIADLAVATPGEARGKNQTREYIGCIDYYTPEEEVRCKALAAAEALRPKLPVNLEQGAVNIVYGSRAGLGAGDRAARIFTQSDAFIGGEAENHDDFGHALATGDFDADGVADLAVSAPGEKRPGAPADGEGEGQESVVHVLPGKREAGLGERKAQTLSRAGLGLPDPGDDAFGYALAAGNLDASRGDDLAVGIPYSRRDGGAVLVLYSAGAKGLSARGVQRWTGSATGIAENRKDVMQFGDALAVGRFGRGPADDLAIGASYHIVSKQQDGSVTVLFGGAEGLSADGARFLAWATPKGRNGDRAGSALSAIPIRDSDRDDLLIGAPGAGENATATDSAGALVEVPTDAAGPRPADARRWRPDSPGVEGDPVRGGTLGHSLG